MAEEETQQEQMPAQPAQSYANHARVVPAYHYVGFGILIINFLWSLQRLVRFFSADAVVSFLMALFFFIVFFYARVFALTAQDRVIRLEMRLRLAQLLPTDLKPRVNQFSVGQLVALRFASDEELPELARKVLNEGIVDRKTIKQMVKDWNPDYLRV